MEEKQLVSTETDKAFSVGGTQFQVGYIKNEATDGLRPDHENLCHDGELVICFTIRKESLKGWRQESTRSDMFSIPHSGGGDGAGTGDRQRTSCCTGVS